MSVAQLTRFKGGKPADMTKAAKQAKTIWMKHGADYVAFSRFHTGVWTGEWLFVVRCADWATFGRAQDAIAKDLAFQKLLTHVLTMAEVTGRTITVGVDL